MPKTTKEKTITNIKNKSTDKTYSREDVPEYLLARGCSLRTPQEMERNRREIMELLKRSEDRIRQQNEYL